MRDVKKLGEGDEAEMGISKDVGKNKDVPEMESETFDA